MTRFELIWSRPQQWRQPPDYFAAHFLSAACFESRSAIRPFDAFVMDQLEFATRAVATLTHYQEVNHMTMDLKDEEKEVVCHALNVYLSDLRGEIVKTEKHDMKADLHREEDVIKSFIARC